MGLSIEKKVGLFFVATIIVVALLLEMVGSLTLFRTQIDYHCYFDEVVGVNSGDTVRLSGVPVGKVRSISLDDDRVRIDFYVEQDNLVKESTIAEIKKANLLGGTFLSLDTIDRGAATLAPGSVLQTRASADINNLIETIDRGADQFLTEARVAIKDLKTMLAASASSIAQITEKANRGNGLFATMLNDEKLATDFKNITSSIQIIGQALADGDGTLGKMIKSDEIYQQINTTTANLKKASEQMTSGEGTLGKLLYDKEFYTSAQQLILDLDSVAKALNDDRGTLGRLIHDPGLHKEFSGLVERAHSIAVKIDEGQGSLGKVVNDDTLYLDVRVAAKKLEKTAEGLRDSGPISALGSILGAFF